MIYYSKEARESHILRINHLKSKLMDNDIGYLESREIIRYLSLLVEQIEKEDSQHNK